MLVRRLARPAAAAFIKGGIDTLLNPEPRIRMAAPKVAQAQSVVGDKLPPQAPTEPEQLVRIDAGVKIGAGVLLALGKFPRIASLRSRAASSRRRSPGTPSGSTTARTGPPRNSTSSRTSGCSAG